jgi:septum formation protein
MMQLFPTNKKYILASNSPRRKQLLADMGISFQTRLKEIAEDYPAELPKEKVATYLSEKKAAAYLPELSDNEVLITADTTVVLDNALLEKSANEQEAFEMLKKISGRTHLVITGVTIASLEKKVTFAVTTKVSFKVLSDEIIRYYVEQYKPFDKAGSYGVQELIGMVGISKIDGSYFNVMGLPTAELFEELQLFLSE